MPPLRAVCIHGHFYQPPREDPWLGVIEPQPSAFPERDWNTRITRECYAPTAAARVLDAHGRLTDVLNCYEWTSFNVGPTLMSWLAAHAPVVVAAMREADERARARTGHGAAWAQAYGHPILPLCSPRDAVTQVRWGARDFEARFGRPPDGMWLPEMAVDVPSLCALAEAGVAMTMLAPHQARRVRPLGGSEAEWRSVTTQTLDVRRLYRCCLPGGRAVDVVFREPGISHDLSFGGLLGDGARLANRLREAMGSGDDDALLAVSVDGETWGHHHRFGEMALAFALRLLREDPSIVLLPPAAFRAHRPPEHEVQLWERTAWSCAHGVERWRSDCGCNVGAGAGWNQAWRTPLRQAVDWLRDELALLYQDRAGLVLRDPWGARDRYVEVVIDPGRIDEFLLAEAGRRTSSRRAVVARRALEMARHALLMQTSCGWFFDDLANIETVQVLKHAARALELAGRLGANLEAGFVERLEIARSNIASEGTGADVWRRRVRDHAPGPSRVAATTAMLTLLERPISLPGYSVSFSAAAARGILAGTASVTETSTGATETVALRAEQGENDAPTCACGDERFSLEDLFGVQREGAFAALARETMLAARAGRRAALGRVRALLGPLLSDGVPLPRDLAIIVGWDEAETLAHAARVGDTSLVALAERAARLQRHGVIFPAGWLAERFGRLLEREVAHLPEGAEAALRLLDLAEAAGVVLDVAPAQAVALAWWRLAPAEMLQIEAVRVLRDRLSLSPDIG